LHIVVLTSICTKYSIFLFLNTCTATATASYTGTFTGTGNATRTDIMSTDWTMYILLKPDVNTAGVKPMFAMKNESRRLIFFNCLLANCTHFCWIIGCTDACGACNLLLRWSYYNRLHECRWDSRHGRSQKNSID